MTFNLFVTKKQTTGKKGFQTKDVLLDFLTSADWISKTDDYFEKESVIFAHDADSPEHQQIFETYRVMIKQSLDECCKHHDLSAEQVQLALNDMKSEAQSNTYIRNLIQPWVIQESFEKFKEAMIEENMESQMLAIESISKRTGLYPLSRKDSDNQSESLAQLEEEVFQRTLRKSKEEYDELQRQLQEEEDAIERALRESERLSQMLISTTETHISVHDLREFVKQSEGLTIVQEEEEEEGDKTEQLPSSSSKLTQILSEHDPDHFVSVKQFISPEELQRRQAYLRAQKEKLHSKRESLQENVAKSNNEPTAQMQGSSPSVISRKELAKILKSQISANASGSS